MDYISKKIVICLFFSSFLLATCFGQASTGVSTDTSKPINDSMEMIIKKIRKEYNKINSDSSKMRVVYMDLNGQSTEGGTVRKYFEENDLRKAIVVFYGETGKAIIEYYFSKGELFFSYERNEEYNRPIYEQNRKNNKIEENRFYFSSQKLVRWINRSGKIEDKSLYSAKEKEILEDLKNIY